MIYFITNCPIHLKKYRENLYNGIEVVEDNTSTYLGFKQAIKGIQDGIIGYDVESNGLDAWKNDTVLNIIGTEKVQFVFHSAFCDLTRYMQAVKELQFTLLGHNIKFDIKYLATEQKLIFTDVWDTMLAEQRLYMKSGLSMSLAQLCFRYLDVYPDAMDKSIRDEFIGCNIKTFSVEPRHLTYGASDVQHLFPVKEKQVVSLQHYKLEFLTNEIEFPLISIIAKAELTGFVFNLEAWLEIYEENLKQKFITEGELDIEVRRLRDLVWGTKGSANHNPAKRLFMQGGKWDKERVHNPMYDVFNDDGSTNALDLFGEPMSKKTLTGTKTKVNKTPNNIAYGSDTQIIEIFALLEEPLPTKQQQLAIPRFNSKGKIDKTFYNYQTGAPVLQEYLSDLHYSKMKPFIKLLLEHRGTSTACSNFGANFSNKINPVTGKIHTSFRQCFAATGRFQSGGGKNEPDKPNFQNIPSKASYAIRMRNCFMAREGYSIGTHDLTGAELIIMCSLSQDMNLLEASKGDMHSFVAQSCWRRIYAHRATNPSNTVEMTAEYVELSRTYTVSKTVNKQQRGNFKPMTFGVIYGMHAAKAGKTLKVSKEEGQIVIDFIEEAFPDVIRMVKSASDFAAKHGYIVLNTRTNSRAWFPNIVYAIKEGIDFKDYNFRKTNPILAAKINKELSEARNIKIQGTQSDMIKEATVELQKWIDDNGLTDETTILSWVHDEIVDEHLKCLDGKSAEWREWREWRLQDNELYYNNKTFTNFPELKAQIMRDTCNKYLTNVKMDVDYDVEPYWTK